MIAELAPGTPKARAEVLGLLDGLPSLLVASVDEVRVLIEARVAGSGIGFVNAGFIAPGPAGAGDDGLDAGSAARPDNWGLCLHPPNG